MPAPQQPRRNRPAHSAPPAPSFRPLPHRKSLAPEALCDARPCHTVVPAEDGHRITNSLTQRWYGNGLRQLLDARQGRRMWAIPYQLGVAPIAEVHTWWTGPTDNCWFHLLSRGRAIVRTRWRTVLVRTALRRAEGMGVEKARAAGCPYRGRTRAACVTFGETSDGSALLVVQRTPPRAPRPPPSCTPASIDTVRASTDSLHSRPTGPSPSDPSHTHRRERMPQAKGAPPPGKRPLDCLWASRPLAVRSYWAAPISSRWVQRPVTEPGKL